MEREPKWKACKRLAAEGRYEEFSKRKAFFRSKEGGGLKFDDAFYAALAEFPPFDQQQEVQSPDPDETGEYSWNVG